MHQLRLFKSTIPHVQIHGDVQFKESDLTLSFKLVDPDLLIKNGFESFEKSKEYVRAHELWKDTCFEAFWSEPGSKKYWEFNFSPAGKWNLYSFDDYRSPSPPKESSDFDLVSVNLKQDLLTLGLNTKKKCRGFEASLCAVVKTKKDDVYYFSTSHQGDKPDFHLRSSFNILTGNK